MIDNVVGDLRASDFTERKFLGLNQDKLTQTIYSFISASEFGSIEIKVVRLGDLYDLEIVNVEKQLTGANPYPLNGLDFFLGQLKEGRKFGLKCSMRDNGFWQANEAKIPAMDKYLLKKAK